MRATCICTPSNTAAAVHRISTASPVPCFCVQYLGELGADFVVYKNDEKTVDEIRAMNPAGILVSPGPGEDCVIDRVVMGVL